jgi:hypothetical protein
MERKVPVKEKKNFGKFLFRYRWVSLYNNILLTVTLLLLEYCNTINIVASDNNAIDQSGTILIISAYYF